MNESNRAIQSKVNNTPEQGTSVTTSNSQLTAASAIEKDPVLGCKLRALLYSFQNIAKDPYSERRINSTTDEHYFSTPFFSENEAMVLKSAVVDVDLSRYNPSTYNSMDDEDADDSADALAWLKGKTVHEAIKILFKSFMYKRRATGDARPRGPHHLAPLYAALFDVKMEELKDSDFLSRLRGS